MKLKILIIAALVVVLFLLITLVATIGIGWADSIQDAVQPWHCDKVWADSLAGGATVTVTPPWAADGFTFAAGEACSLMTRPADTGSCIDTTYQHFEKGESFEFAVPRTKEVVLTNKATPTGFYRFWFWRR